jgi:hypothetical protein
VSVVSLPRLETVFVRRLRVIYISLRVPNRGGAEEERQSFTSLIGTALRFNCGM